MNSNTDVQRCMHINTVIELERTWRIATVVFLLMAKLLELRVI